MIVDGSILWQVFLAVTAVSGIAGFITVIYKTAKRIEKAIGVDKNGRTLSERMDRVEHQLWENGGSSLADRVNRIEQTSNATAAEVAVVKELMLVVVEKGIKDK